MDTPFDEISTPPARRIAHGLAKIALVIRHRDWARGESHGLTPTQAQILALVAARGPLRLSAVAAELAVTSPTASDAAAALVRKRLLRKTAAPGDGRAVVLALTAAGARRAEALESWPDLLGEAVAEMPADEQAVVLRALTRTIRGLQTRGAIPVQRMCATCRYFRPDRHADADTPHHCAYVDAPFGDRHLRLDCPEHAPAQADSKDTGETA